MRWFLLVAVVACSANEPNRTEIGPVFDRALPIVDLLVEVTVVADGDSFRVVANGEELEVRLLGINAPELGECYGPESATWLTETIEGKDVGLALEPEPDQFGRVLAVAIVDQVDVNKDALKSGHAVVVNGEGIDWTSYVAAEEEARSAETGMWADDICGASGPRAAVGIESVEFDPPGPDQREAVIIINNGNDDIDVGGFVLRDESSVNRFVLPAEILAAGSRLEIAVMECRFDKAYSPLVWCSDQPVFNNDGDTAMLLDPFGRVIALSRYRLP